jgi:hypothetical protein
VSDRAVAAGLGLAVLAQGGLLLLMGDLGWRLGAQTLLVAAALGAVIRLAWLRREQLDHHVDMALVMAAWGGLGMLAGWWIDLARGAPPPCHLGTGPLWQGAITWMTFLMLAGAIPPALAWTRCAALARSSRARWAITHVAGNLAMVAGMLALGRALGPVLGASLGSPLVGGHLAMLLGMVGGMEAAMWLGEWAAGLRPWEGPQGRVA